MTRRLYKSRTDRMIDGVCGGVAEFFYLDPTLVRIAWVLLTVLGGSGVLLYIAGMIIIPVNPAATETAAGTSVKQRSMNNQRFWGILLIGTGLFWLMGNLGFHMWHHWWGFSWNFMLPLVLILAGVAFLFGGRNYIMNTPPADASEGQATPEDATAGAQLPRPARLFRSRVEKKMFGVCGGLGMYFNIDPTLVRVLFVVSAFASFGATVFLYVLMAIVVPKEPQVAHASS